jgi:hypothetical protein
MDKIHYSEQINYLLYEHMVNGQRIITAANYENVLKDLREMVEAISTEYIFNYYDY